jgi:predicted nucleic acid-binding protein
MNGERVSLDANVLVYAADRTEPERHEKAVSLVDQAVEWDCVLTIQALSEFFAVVTRKGKMPLEDAAGQVRDWQELFPVVTPKSTALLQAIVAVKEHSLAFWDAMLWSVAKDADVTLLLSEDFQHGRELGGVRFNNPFASLGGRALP